MRISIRQSEILEFIIDEPQSSISKIAHVLNLSEKTVRKDVITIQQFVKKHDSEILQNVKRELFLHSLHADAWLKNKIVEHLAIPIHDLVKVYILLNNVPTTIQKLADLFFYTKPNMEKIVKNELFEDKKIVRKRNYGMQYAGTKREKFDEIVSIVDKYSTLANFDKIIVSIFSQIPVYSVESALFIKLKNCVVDYINETDTRYSDKAIRNLYIYFLLLYLESDENTQSVELTNEEAFKFHTITSKYKILIHDLVFLNEIFTTLRQYEIDITNEDNKSEVHHIRINIQREVKERLNLIITYDDEVLNKQFEDHIFQTLKRISTENFIVTSRDKAEYSDIITNFRTTYPIAFEAGHIALSILENYLVKKANDVEVVYFGIYFQLFLGNQIKTIEKKVLLICEHGFGIINFISSNLKKKFPDFKEIDTVSTFQFINNPELYSTYDLYVTTVNNLYVEKSKQFDFIVISTLVSDDDVYKIREKYMQSIYKTVIERSYSPIIEIKTKYTTKESLLEIVNKNLLSMGIVTSDFFQSLLEREKIAPTDFNEIAIPHGDPAYVLKSSYILITLEKPIIWNTHFISVVAMFVATKEDLLNYRESISIFYEHFASDDFIKKLISAQSHENIVNVILGG